MSHVWLTVERVFSYIIQLPTAVGSLSLPPKLLSSTHPLYPPPYHNFCAHTSRDYYLQFCAPCSFPATILGQYISYGFALVFRKVLMAYGYEPCNINISLRTVSVMIAVFIQIFSVKLANWLGQVTQKSFCTIFYLWLTAPSYTTFLHVMSDVQHNNYTSYRYVYIKLPKLICIK